MGTVLRMGGALWLAMGAAMAVPDPQAARAEDPIGEIQKRFEQRQRQGAASLADVEARFRGVRAAMEADWARMERDVEARWQRDKRAIERKWGEALRSTKKEWVDYSPDFETRSVVDFEAGTVEVTALVPRSQTGATRDKRAKVPAAAQEEIAQQFNRILAQPGGSGKAILEGQMVSRTGRPVTRQDAGAFVKQEVLPALEVDPKPVQSPDGVERVKVTARVKLTPDHLKKRARQYLELVLQEARRNNLDPRLVFAVIQTESYFNPKAQSPAPAYGLMQLVPRAAARDAYNSLYGQDRVLDPEYLTDPAHNVELGAAYLRILMTGLFADLPPGEKQVYVAVCAYNWGPTNIRDKVLKRFPVRDLSEPQVFALLTEKTPEETRTYLKRVTERRSLYEELVRR